MTTILDPLAWQTIQPGVDALLAVELKEDNVKEWLLNWSHLSALLSETDAQIYREVNENTADEEAEKRFLLLIEEIAPKVQMADQALKKKLLAFEGQIPLETEQMLKRFRAEAAIYRDENVPLLSQLMRLGNDYDKIVGGMTIEWEGERRTLPQVQFYLYHSARDKRVKAWRLMMDAYLEKRDELNDLYLEMLRYRRQVAQNAGFKSFRDYQWQALGRFDYTPEDCFTFHDAIEHEVVPLANECYKRLKEQLGVDSLCPWDTKVDPLGDALHPFDNVARLEAGGVRIFQQVDPELAKHFMMMQDGFLDLASRPNKAPGGYCNSFPLSGKAYIFMNAVGSHRDVTTLLHEGGHAFHFMESLAQPLIWNYNGPMEFCEVASMAMELLSAPYLSSEAGGFYSEADARRAYRQQLIDNSIFFLPYMAVVDAFQHWVYTEASENVTASDLDNKWSELWDRFMPGINFNGLQSEKETGWHRKSHIFTSPFYYIEYGLAQIGALQIWRNALTNQAQAVANYRAALALGDTRPLPELFQVAGATFAFDRQTVGDLMRLVGEQLEKLQQAE